ncbi:hypothetical protein CEP54_010620 [Fusarium duplospermum]|uniref:Uncharacterized protein n=1 Tax=Fusarium duplospermum TaxID=1325734 RepID=A0A428PJ17_9HYPO|nr:hypothetical protein CEP54_010620 [Fusarium duplospermum]
MSDFADLCPLDESRTSRELIIKLVVAHLTGVTVFCNLVSLRNDPLNSIEPILFLFSPLVVPVQTTIGLAFMIFEFVVNVIKSPSSIREQGRLLDHRWRLLFCPKAEPKPKVETLEMSQDGFLGMPSEKKPARPNLDGGSAWVRLGSTIITFGTLFHCVATIFLYNRRIELHGKESLTVADNRCFEIAVGSGVVSILSIALLLRFPGFTQPAPEVDYKMGPREDRFYLFFRGDPRRCDRWWQFIYIKEIGSDSTADTFLWCFLSSSLNGTSIVVSIAKFTYPGLYEGLVTQEGDHISMYDFYRNLVIIVAILIFIIALFKRRPQKDETAWSIALLSLVALSSLALLVFGTIFLLYPFLFLWFPGMLSGIGSILFIRIKELRMLLGQPPFALASDEFPPCPALWKDPMAEYIWSLI